MVQAHTSAGKTVVAEFIISSCLSRNQRVIYTSPIKSLSNQKYREFKNRFGRVGLITGDTQKDPEELCLIMTTEILRNMFYKQSELMKDLGWIIFDEFHFIGNPGRGVIWEETIILAPRNTRYCFLSATMPNALQLAGWIR